MKINKITALAAAIVFSVVLSACQKKSVEAENINDSKIEIEAEKKPKIGVAKEIITLKGVPFGQPGMVKAVENLCKSKEMLTPCNKFKKHKENEGFTEFMTLNFGNLSAWSYRNGLKLFNARVDFDKEGSLVAFSMGGRTEDVRELAKILSEKYGEPLINQEQVKNGVGNQFTNEIFSWTDEQGTHMIVRTIAGAVDQGSVAIVAASFIESKKREAEKINEIYKGNL